MIFRKTKRIKELDQKVLILTKRVEALERLLNQKRMVRSEKPRVLHNDPK